MRAVVRAATSPLLRVLDRSAAVMGVVPIVSHELARPWATATFGGTLYRITLRDDPSPSFARWLAELPETELDIPGAVVLSLVVEAPTTIALVIMEVPAATAS